MSGLRCLLPKLTFAAAAVARNLYVNPTGRDKADGLGQKTAIQMIAWGLELAQPDDTVHLARAVYREAALFHNR